MKIFVTGALGFIGTNVCKQLLQAGHTVIGIDAYIGPTPSRQKEEGKKKLQQYKEFQLIEASLLHVDLPTLLQNVDVVYHLAAIPGVRSSWGRDFELYTTNNVLATQRLLEACKGLSLKRFIFISTSSVYGEKVGKVSEDMTTEPLSPYGVTKLTCEKLCYIYQHSFQIPIVVLRYFTVYGPGQRPDMAFHRFIQQLLTGSPITIFGDGTQTRDFTYITDCVAGTVAALSSPNIIGETINIGGKERASILEVLTMLEEITGKKGSYTFTDSVHGEPKHTWADIAKAETLLSYAPKTSLRDGLQREYMYFQQQYREE